MTLAELFLAVNAAGLSLANVGGRLDVRGPDHAITPDILTGAAEHKDAILALLPATPVDEGEIGIAEGEGEITPAEATACPEWEQVIRDQDWRDWRLEWL